MGKNFCVCNDASSHENESNIFSGFNTNRHLEKEIKTLNSINQINTTLENKTNPDYNSLNNNNYGLNTFFNEVCKERNNNQKDNNNKLPPYKNENFQYSGHFNSLLTNSNQQKLNGGNENNDINSLNMNNNKNANNNIKESGNIINKNEFGFVSFKSFNDCNNNTGELKGNKDNNTNNIMSQKIEQSIDINKNIKNKNIDTNNEYKDKTKIEHNSFSIFKDKKENGNSKDLNEDNDYRYNNISQYSDMSDKDYLNNESNYYNSNQREENRDNQSLYNEDSQNSQN